MSSTKTLEIQHALSAYCHYVDNGSVSAIADLFAEDAVLMPYYDGQYDVIGKQEIHRWYQFYLDKMKASVKNLRHSISTTLVEEEGTAVTSHCHLTAIFTIRDNNKTYQAQGSYIDKFINHDSIWLFQTRRIEINHINCLGDAIGHMRPIGYEADTQ